MIRNLKIRESTKKDLRDIKRLIRYLMGVEKTDDIKKQTALIINDRVIPTFKKSSLNKIFLAEINDKTVGLIIVEIKFKRIASIAYIVIEPKYQKAGIGKVLINYASKYAKKLKIKEMQVLVHKDNKKAQQFYKKQKISLFCYLLKKKLK